MLWQILGNLNQCDMTKLEQLYNSIQSLKELGVQLPDKLIEETNRIEEEIIQNEVMPTLSDAIDPIINQIQRELILVVEYIPNEPLQVRMTRKRSFRFREEEGIQKMEENEDKQETKIYENRKINSYTLPPHTKSKRTNFSVTFPNGKEISNKFAYQTLCEVIEMIGPEKVARLGIRNRFDLVSKIEDDFYQQYKVEGDWFVLTHSSTDEKIAQIEEISKRLNFGLQVVKNKNLP